MDVFKKVAESPEFKKNYIEKYQSLPVYIAGKDAQKYFEQAQKDCIDANVVVKK
jgi:tripartite-type tricarboxylate transporter receptor subunit TctC